MANVHKYDGFSDIHNFFFHPLHRKSSAKKVLAVITNIFLTMVSAGLWQVPFWIVNRLDHKKVRSLKKEEVSGVNKAASVTQVFPQKKPQDVSAEEKADETKETAPVKDDVIAPEIPKMAFGGAEWVTYFGNVGTVPDLPLNINEILSSPCKIFPGKKVEETHILVLIPEKVDNQPLTLESLSYLIQSPNAGGHKSEYARLGCMGGFSDAIKKQAVPSHWVLMTKDVIGGEDQVNGTRFKSYDEQVAMVNMKAKESGIPYQAPTVRDAAVALSMHHARSGDHLLGGEPYTYTRCQEVDRDNDHYAVGNFAFSRLSVDIGGACFGKGSRAMVASCPINPSVKTIETFPPAPPTL